MSFPHDPDGVFTNLSRARGTLTLRQLFSEDGSPGPFYTLPPVASVLVSSFGLYAPFADLSSPANPLVRFASLGARVTAVNEWRPEGDPASASIQHHAAQAGISPAQLVTGGAHALASGVTLVHPPMAQHVINRSTGAWFVRRRGADLAPHPTVRAAGERRAPGCVHPKLILVRFASGALRVVVSSGNLGAGEWEHMTQCGWAQTFPPLGSGSSGGAAAAAVAAAPTGGGATPLAPTGGARVGGGDGAPLETVYVSPVLGDFSANLRYALSRMTVPQPDIAALCDGVDFSGAAADLVFAMPGSHCRQPPDVGVRQAAGSGGGGGGAGGGTAGSAGAVACKSGVAAASSSVDGATDASDADSSDGESVRKRPRVAGGAPPPAAPPAAAVAGLARGAAHALTLERMARCSLDPRHFGNALAGHHRLRVLRHYHLRVVCDLASVAVAAGLDVPAELRSPREAALIIQGSSVGDITQAEATAWLESSNGLAFGTLGAEMLHRLGILWHARASNRQHYRAPAGSYPAPVALVWPSRAYALAAAPQSYAHCVCWNAWLTRGPQGQPPFALGLLHHYEENRGEGEGRGGSGGAVGVGATSGVHIAITTSGGGGAITTTGDGGASPPPPRFPHAKSWIPAPLPAASADKGSAFGGGGGAQPLGHAAAAVGCAPQGPSLREVRNWCVVGSANPSLSAWGSAPDERGWIRALNWECSALLPPVYALRVSQHVAAAIRGERDASYLPPADAALVEHLRACSFRVLPQPPLPHDLHFCTPIVPYSEHDDPFVRPTDEAGQRDWTRAVARAARGAEDTGGGGSGSSDEEEEPPPPRCGNVL